MEIFTKIGKSIQIVFLLIAGSIPFLFILAFIIGGIFTLSKFVANENSEPMERPQPLTSFTEEKNQEWINKSYRCAWAFSRAGQKQLSLATISTTIPYLVDDKSLFPTDPKVLEKEMERRFEGYKTHFNDISKTNSAFFFLGEEGCFDHLTVDVLLRNYPLK